MRLNTNSFRQIVLIFVTSFCILAFARVSRAQVWAEKNTWSPAWEKSYESWVQSEWTVDIFSRKILPNGEQNPFFGLRTDCADTVYSMRIIFAFKNSLPFAAVDPTGGGTLITNRMTRWNSISSEAQRTREFLLFVYDTFSTRSLPADTYPVAISRETVRAGGLMMTTAKNHHSWTIQSLLSIGVPHLIFNSTVGASSGSTLQERTSWPNPEWVFEGQFNPGGNGGLRYWRQISDLNKPVWEVQGYSDDQYKIPLSNWNDVVQKKLALVSEAESEKIQRLMESVCAGIQARVQAVKEGLSYANQIGHRCMTYEEYDTYSTPNRDRRVFDDLIALRRTYKSIVQEQKSLLIPQKVRNQLAKIFPAIGSSVLTETQTMVSQKMNADSVCSTSYSSDRQLDMAEYKRRAFLGLLSNIPNDGLEQRWGELRSVPNLCKTWDVWSPQLVLEN